MKTTLADFRDMLFNLRGARSVSIVAETIPRLTDGKSCPLVGMTKIAYVNGMINWSYANAVNAQRIREGMPVNDLDEVEHFVPEARKWGTRLHDVALTRAGKPRMIPLVCYEKRTSTITLEELQEIPFDELYLEYKFEKSLEHHYYLNGSEVLQEEAEKYLPPKRDSGRQEVENAIIIRDYTLTNLRQVMLGGDTYEIAKAA